MEMIDTEKLTKEEKKEAMQMWRSGQYTLRYMSRWFGVSEYYIRQAIEEGRKKWQK